MRKLLKSTLSIAAALVVGLGALGGAALFLTTSMPTSSIAAEKTVSGKVMYRERIALPPEAKLTVQLADISLADAPSTTIAETRIESAQGSPIPFAINFDTDQIQSGHTYALQARITAGDTLWFVNDQNYTIDPANPGAPVEMRVVMVRKSADEAVSIGIEGKDWLAEDIQGGGVIDNAQTTLTVTSDGSVSGSGGCNRYFSKATVTGENISFAEVGSTYMQCPPALMNQERKFLDTLTRTRSYKIDTVGKLVLLDQEGKEIATLAQNL
ncbi:MULTISPECIES: YbaY family lipoprotein [Brucella/Ochrobactrum group]|uniref:META domain-containing protein n=2 Tax=Ochrobactrum TaxID=528 RepID=A0ABD5JXD1_9HYPH|nr:MULTISPECIES: YbaY family lipoprotein [Brucella]MCI1000869.1 YbaY family lipoprotein [Ochrobactrum sp. C6C9]RRD25791.1 META domain-containing protein [Brucellaceae bacterium VT-16-1752]WHT42799.1 YbaY family lipoprotein [Ochrobactrum sp. SSR]MDX4072576.1 YbaY family lipoprotein [Brucella sp. NBRC 113783]NNU62492.1 META domain-containing protein [[Ochrobactrum] soli]